MEREDLNAIEEVHGFAKMLEPVAAGGLGLNQAQVAAKLNRDPSYVSNRLRLLKLPKRFQDWLVSQEIPPTHARVLAGYVDYAPVMKSLERLIAGRLKDNEDLGTVADFKEMCEEELSDATEPLEYLVRMNGDNVLVKAVYDDVQAQDLKIVDVELPKWEQRKGARPRSGRLMSSSRGS